jgi:hypothetical protein
MSVQQRAGPWLVEEVLCCDIPAARSASANTTSRMFAMVAIQADIC